MEMMTAGKPAQLDITAETCPMTFVRTRLALDALPSGARLHVRLRGAEPLRNVTRSAEALGHAVVSREENADGSFTLVMRKA